MRCVGCVSGAVTAAAAFVICCVCVVTGTARAGDDGAHFLLFSGADLWRDGRFMHGGLLWSPDGLDREGFTLKAAISGGRYRYVSGTFNNAWVIGTDEEVQVLPGWRFKRDRLELKVFAGLDIKNDATSPYDPGNRLHGTSLGARATVNLWFEPTPATMLAADASLSSIAAAIPCAWPMAGGWTIGFMSARRRRLSPAPATTSCVSAFT
jgi:hypothetical protein